MSYPDLIEEDGRFYITETQKSIGRVHEIPASLLDSRTAASQGLCAVTTGTGALWITLNDGRTVASWESDSDVIRADMLHHVVVIVDGGPKIIKRGSVR